MDLVPLEDKDLSTYAVLVLGTMIADFLDDTFSSDIQYEARERDGVDLTRTQSERVRDYLRGYGVALAELGVEMNKMAHRDSVTA